MLPYTPMHHLLLNQTDPTLAREPVPPVLVMTSGNFSEEPIATDNVDAQERLAPLADAFLIHNRDIVIRCDDSVRRGGGFVRRARGYVPRAIKLEREVPSVLAVGGWFKNTVCVTRGDEAFVSFTSYVVPSQVHRLDLTPRAQGSPPAQSLLIVAFVIFAIWVADRAVTILNANDPGCVVIDEIAGFLVTMTGLDFTLKNVILGFLLFRFFDILKPFPVKNLEDGVSGGAGVVADDVAAGVAAVVLLALVTAAASFPRVNNPVDYAQPGGIQGFDWDGISNPASPTSGSTACTRPSAFWS